MKIRITTLLNSIKNKAILIVLLIAAQSAAAHEGHHTKQAWQACETKSIGDNCSYVMQTNHFFQGSCRQMTQALMCVRNQPIKTLSDEQLKEIVKQAKNPPE